MKWLHSQIGGITDEQSSKLVLPVRVWVRGLSFGAQEPCTKRNRDREHLELRRSQREQPGLAMRQKNETGELAHSHPNYVVYSGVCANCSGAPINAILDGKMSILLTDHRRLRHRPRHVLWLIPQSAPAVYLVSRL